MSQLNLVCFGALQATLNGKRLTHFHSAKVQCLLAYLALEADRAHHRETLAALLWPQDNSGSARSSLRQALYILRQLLGDKAVPDASAPFLLVNRQTVQFNPASNYTLDVADFMAAIARGQLAQAVTLYRADLLTGLACDSIALDEWLLFMREHLRTLFLGALDTLTGAALAQGDSSRARLYAQRQLACEPWREQAHRQLMLALVLGGERSAALAQYETCRRVLATELGMTPEGKTVALYEQIRTGKFDVVTRWQGDTVTPCHLAILSRSGRKAPSSQHPVTLSPTYDCGEMPTIDAFHGRQAEIKLLTTWLMDGTCRLVAILGMGGQGKTALAAHLVRTIALGHPTEEAGEADATQRLTSHERPFVCILWRSLLNAPPLAEILTTWVHFLSGQKIAELPASLDAQLALLVDLLRSRRCLLVLDNVESILQSGGGVARAGDYRPGYTDYGQLFRRISQSEHNSCLLLTSRECPRNLSLLAQDMLQVRILPLAGLDATAGHEMMQRYGLDGAAPLVSALVERYSGNPLALKLIVELVQDFYAGDIALFLTEESLVFGDIRDVLDQQFDRLSPLEQEILFWLALEREAITLPVLRANLLRPPPQHGLLDALRSLERRSLLERSAAGFTLQNVVTEYLTSRFTETISQELVSGAMKLFASHALYKAQAMEYVRQSQERLILHPIISSLSAHWDMDGIAIQLQRRLRKVQSEPSLTRSYAGGNILNLLLQLGVNLQGFDFSHLAVWQVHLRGVILSGVSFCHADLRGSTFTDAFGHAPAIAFHPEGSGLAAGGNDGAIRMWRVGDWQPFGFLRANHSLIWAIAFSPNGHYLASGGEDNLVHLWDLRNAGDVSGREVQTLRGHTGWVRCLAFSPDGRLLASGSWDHTVQVWDIRDVEGANSQPTFTLCGHAGWVGALAFSLDGRFLATGSWDHTIRLWDMHTGKSLGVLEGHSDTVKGVAFSPDSNFLASCSADHTVRLWDLSSLDPDEPVSGVDAYILHGHTDWVASVAFSSDGLWLASASRDRTIRLWDVARQQTRHVLTGHTSWIDAVSFHPRPSRHHAILASSGRDQTMRLWDVHTGRPLHTLHGYTNGVEALSFSQDGRFLISGGADHVVRLWGFQASSLETGAQEGTPWATAQVQVAFGHSTMIKTVAFSLDGRLVATGTREPVVRLWQVDQPGRPVQILYGHNSWIESVAFSPDGLVLASSSQDQTVRLWEVESGQLRCTLHGHTRGVRSVAFGPRGMLLATGGEDHIVRLWDVCTGRLMSDLIGHSDWVHAIAFSPNGALVASASRDHSVRLWHVGAGQRVSDSLILQGHTNAVKAVAFNPDGKTLASGGWDGVIHLWNVCTGEVIAQLKGHTNVVSSLAFCPDGRYLVSGSLDETIRFWEMRSGACLHTLRAAGPYAQMNITGVTGITPAQRESLKALGAVDSSETDPVRVRQE